MSRPSGVKTDDRPWGSYTVLDDDETHRVKHGRSAG
jgi:hypothetical protein